MEGIHRRTRFEVTPSLLARFNRRVSKGQQGECWLWDGAVRNGYGAIKNNHQVLGVHVVAYVISHGEVPKGRLVCHTCDQRLCCNPAHLYAGTFSDNVVDMRERHETGNMQGEEAWNAGITEQTAILIKAYRVARGWGATQLAKVIDASRSTIECVIYEKSWKHVAWPTKEAACAIVHFHEVGQCGSC